jgi:hypothetical protein
MFEHDSNFLGFAACMRGLLESVADGYYALCRVPEPIARSAQRVNSVFVGNMPEDLPCPAEEVENALIHFTHARNLAKENNPQREKKYQSGSGKEAEQSSGNVGASETFDNPHRARRPNTYVGGFQNARINGLYDSLCQRLFGKPGTS